MGNPAKTPQKILIVDDYEMVRIMLRRCLGQLGFSEPPVIEEAIDGKQAIEILQAAAKGSEPFSLVFSDLNMPRMNGFELLSACRKDPRLAKLPFIIISAEAEGDYISQALGQGATDYIIKPFSTETLRAKLEKLPELLQELRKP